MICSESALTYVCETHAGEKTATYLNETAQLLMNEYKGDVNNLREAAGRVYQQERELLKKIKGVCPDHCESKFQMIKM